MLGGEALLSPSWFIHAQNIQDLASSSNKDLLQMCKLWLRCTSLAGGAYQHFSIIFSRSVPHPVWSHCPSDTLL